VVFSFCIISFLIALHTAIHPNTFSLLHTRAQHVKHTHTHTLGMLFR
jgi:hypothetical protein